MKTLLTPVMRRQAEVPTIARTNDATDDNHDHSTHTHDIETVMAMLMNTEGKLRRTAMEQALHG